MNVASTIKKVSKYIVIGVLVILSSPIISIFLLRNFREVAKENEVLYQKLSNIDQTRQTSRGASPVLGSSSINIDEYLPPKPVAGELVISKAAVNFGHGDKGLVTLSSSSPTIYKTDKIEQYCGSSELGLNNYNGQFYLMFQGQKLDLGELSFSDGTPHDGQLRLYKLDTTSDRDFIAIFQYGSCNVDYLSLYGLGDIGQLIQYSFKYKNGVIRKMIPVERWSLPEVPKDKILVTTWYDNTVENGGQKKATWRFNESANSFDEV